MTFAAIDESRDLGQPLELYYFRFGSDPSAFYAYNDGEPETFDYGGDTYVGLPMKRGSFVQGGTLDKSSMVITVPMESEIAELFRIYPPGQTVTVTIRGGHLNDPDLEFPVIWVGRVLSAARASGAGAMREVELTCESAITSMKRTGLRRFYQLTCPHILYGEKCGANKASKTVPGTISALTYTSLTLIAGWETTLDPTKFVGGTVEWDGTFNRERRSILRVTGNLLSLSGPTTGLAITDVVDVVAGCNHTLPDCTDFHEVPTNFGGFPFIPLKNPIHTNPFS